MSFVALRGRCGRRARFAQARRRVVVLFAALALGAALSVEPAAAHSFLVGTSPAQGERLASPPQAVVLEFSERVDASSVVVSLRTGDDQRVDAGSTSLAGGDLEVRLGVEPDMADGVYVVAWEAVSAVDGHGSAGEFAFALGDTGVIPASAASSSTSVADVALSWLFFAGLAAAAGGLVLQAAADPAVLPARLAQRGGLLAAMAGVLGTLIVGDARELSLLFALQALAAAMVAVGLRWRWPAGVAVVVAAGLWAAGSHGSARAGVVGWLVDVVHLMAGAAWVGALVLAAWTGWRLRRDRDAWLILVRSYGRVAVILVAVLGVAGVVAAFQLLPSWQALWRTEYGRLVTIKAVLFAAAVLLAGTARWWWLRSARTVGLRRTMTVEGGVLVAALVVASLLVNGAPPEPAGAAERLLGPPPLAAPVARDAGLAGQLNVEVAADGDRLDVKVFGPSGPLSGTTLELATRAAGGPSRDLAPRPCGTGCFTQAFDLAPGATTVRVTAAAPDWIGGTYEAQLVWPPGTPGSETLREVVTRMRSLPEITVTETVTSGPGSKVTPSTFTMSGERFIAAEPYAAANLDDVRLLAGAPSRLVLYLPGSQIFGALELDDVGRIAAARLVTRGHDITRTFSYPSE